MSRRHFVDFTCDRCYTVEKRPGKSDMNPPPGWQRIDGYDLCEVDAGAYLEQLDALQRKFFKLTPDMEPRTIIDEELEELDPETHLEVEQ